MLKRLKVSFHSVYILFMTGVMLLQMFFWSSPAHQQKISAVYLWPAAIVMLVLLLRRMRGKLPAGMPVMLGMVAWVFVTCIVNGDPYLTFNHQFMLGTLLSFGLCYPTFLLVEREKRTQWMMVFGGAVVGALVLLSWAGIYVALLNTAIVSPFSGEAIRINENRLYAFSMHPNEIACLLVSGLFLSVSFVYAAKRRWSKACGIVCAVSCYLAVALTVSRTAAIIVSVGLGMLVFLLVIGALRDKKQLLCIACGGGAAILTAALLFFSFSGVVSLVAGVAEWIGEVRQAPNAVSIEVAPVIASASAEGLEDTRRSEEGNKSGVLEGGAMPTASSRAVASAQANAAVGPQQRDIMKDLSTFTNRTEIWGAGIQTLKDRPLTLLTGMLDSQVARIPRNMLGRTEYHMHNAWLEIILLTGIPGLALYLCFVIRLLRSAIRLFFAKAAPFYQRVLAILPAVLLINGLMEIYPAIAGKPMDMLFYAVSGAVIGFAQEQGKETSAAVLSET